MKYTIRLDDVSEHNTLESLTKFLDSPRYTSYLIYREISDEVGKLHYQGVVEFDHEALSWHKERWSRIFKMYKKGSKSTALMKKNNYEIYITKDKDRILTKGYTEEFIAELESSSYKKEDVKKVDYYDRFMYYIKQQQDIDVIKYDRRRLCAHLIKFFGMEKQDIKNIQFYKSLMINVQARLIYGCTDHDSEKVVERLIDLIMF